MEGNVVVYIHLPQTCCLFCFYQRQNHSGACQSPTPAILQRLSVSSDYHSPAPVNLQRLPSSSACHSPAPTILQRPPFSSDYHFPTPPFSSVYSAYHFLVTTVSAPPALKWFAP